MEALDSEAPPPKESGCHARDSSTSSAGEKDFVGLLSRRTTESQSARTAQSARKSIGIGIVQSALNKTVDNNVDKKPKPLLGIFQLHNLIGLVLAIILFFSFVFVQISDEHPKANRMLAVTAFTACFWVFEVIPLPAASLIPMALMPFTGIDSTERVAGSYFNGVQMLVIAILIMNTAFEKVKLLDRLGLVALSQVGVSNPALVLAMFCFIAWAASMFCSVVAVSGLLAPLAINIADAARRQVTDKGGTARDLEHCERFCTGLLLGICCSCSAGGLATLIGSPPNLVLAGQDVIEGQIDFAVYLAFAMPVSITLVSIIYGVIYLGLVRGVQVELESTEIRASLAKLGPLNRDEKGMQ